MQDPARRSLQNYLAAAHDIAETSGAAYCRPEHILLAVLDDPDLEHLTESLLETSEGFREEVEERVDVIHQYDRQTHGGPLYSFSYSPHLPEDTAKILESARRLAAKGRFPQTSGIYFFLAMAESEGFAADLIRRHGATKVRIEKYLSGAHVVTEGDDPLDHLQIELQRAAQFAPEFILIDGRLSFKQQTPKQALYSHKLLVQEYLEQLQDVCERKRNSLPTLDKMVQRYAVNFRRMGRKMGAYRLYIDGAAIEACAADPETDEVPPLDNETKRVLESFLISHALLMSIFPDVRRLSDELSKYVQDSKKIGELRDTIMRPNIRALNSATRVFDKPTIEIGIEVERQLAQAAARHVGGVRAAESVGHGWLRGALAAMGKLVLEGAKKLGWNGLKRLEDRAIGDDTVLGAIVSHIVQYSSQLFELAKSAPSAFGWLRHLIGLVLNIN